MQTWIKNLLKKGERIPIPRSVKPMLCTLVKSVPISSDFIYEIKWDGYRLIGYKQQTKVRLNSRSALDYSVKYPPIINAIKKLKYDVVLDGEAVVFNSEGKPDFEALQNYNGHTTPISYYAFDLLWLYGYNLTSLPLVERKKILKVIVKGNEVIKYSDDFNDGLTLFEQVEKMEMEGIIAKRADSRYVQGERGNNWFKIPTAKRQEFVIGAWAESDKNRSFRSLLFGAYNKDGEFEWIGRSGGGYKDKEMPRILKQLKELEIDKSPFINKVLDTKGATMHWVKPKLVANFSFAAWTKSGRIRKPATFLGFRKDKKATEVVREIPKEIINESITTTHVPKENKKKLATSEKSNWKIIERQKIVSEEEFTFSNCSIKLHNVEREIWKGITKADLIQYYHSIAPIILPHLKDRPESLHLKLINAYTEGLYVKDMEGRQPKCADIFRDKRKHKKEGKRSTIDYLVCNNEETLLYMVNLGCIDINPWTARTYKPDEPDFIVIDLDPSDEDFKKAIETARAAKEYFDEKKLKAFIKTSGKTGIHLYIPCSGFNFTIARTIAEKICNGIHDLVPSITTTEVSIANRGNKLYLDPNQNDYADTVAAPYSVRPFKIPAVSTPLEWKEIRDTLKAESFTIKTINQRIKKKGDLFKDALDKKLAQKNTKYLLHLQ